MTNHKESLTPEASKTNRLSQVAEKIAKVLGGRDATTSFVLAPVLALILSTTADQTPASAAEFNQALNNNAGATTTVVDANELLAKPTATATKAAPTPEATATPIVEKTREVRIIDIPGGINRRKSPNGEIIDTTAGKPTDITSYERTDKEIVTVGDYSWVQVKDIDGTEFWVALIPGKVKERTETITISGIGGGWNAENYTYEQLLAEARKKLGDEVADVELVDGVYTAFTALGNSLGKFANGQWYSTLPTTSSGVIERQTVLTEDSDKQIEAVFQTMTFEEFSEIHPELVSPEVIGDGNLLYVGANGLQPVSSEINIKLMSFRDNGDGSYDIVNPEGVVLFHKTETKNPDEKLNNSWMQPMVKSEKGLFNVYVDVKSNDPTTQDRLPDKPFVQVFGVLANNTNLIDSDPTAYEDWKNPDPAVIADLIKYLYISPDTEPTTNFENPLQRLDRIVELFFRKLAKTSGEIPQFLEILLPSGETAQIDTTKGVNFQIYNTPGILGWLKDLKGSSEHANVLTAVPYTVENGQLTVYMVHNYSSGSWPFNNAITNAGLGNILHNNNISGDADFNALAPDKVTGITRYKDLSQLNMQLIKDSNGNVYLIPNLVLAQKPINRSVISYSTYK